MKQVLIHAIVIVIIGLAAIPIAIPIALFNSDHVQLFGVNGLDSLFWGLPICWVVLSLAGVTLYFWLNRRMKKPAE